MLGNAMLRVLAADAGLDVVATARGHGAGRLFEANLARLVVEGVDVENCDSLANLFADLSPAIVINCVGVVKQLAQASDVLASVPINTLLPHRLSRLCEASDARLVHFSTDCVFSGKRGNYGESDRADATDVYGLSKLLGEVSGPNAITLRTSMVGRELTSSRSLLDWFLSQRGSVKGYRRAIFSGLPTVELARIVRDLVIPRPDLHGLYHVSAEPISKFDLLQLFADAYQQDVEIVPDDGLVIDRSLNSDRFRNATGYRPRSWPELVAEMRRFD
jgi:dTDP-4-dehydrorhamnose reductase